MRMPLMMRHKQCSSSIAWYTRDPQRAYLSKIYLS